MRKASHDISKYVYNFNDFLKKFPGDVSDLWWVCPFESNCKSSSFFLFPQAQVIIDIIAQFNWTYIIVINSEGSYGEMGGKAVRTLAAENGICVAYSHEIIKAR